MIIPVGVFVFKAVLQLVKVRAMVVVLDAVDVQVTVQNPAADVLQHVRRDALQDVVISVTNLVQIHVVLLVRVLAIICVVITVNGTVR